MVGIWVGGLVVPLIDVNGRRETIQCDHCMLVVQRAYRYRSPKRVFCSRRCRNEHLVGAEAARYDAGKHEAKCELCGGDIGKHGVRFCSRSCSSNYRIGKSRGRVEHHAGYYRRYAPEHPIAGADGYVLEHRLVVFEAGIDIPQGYHVHHLNHNKTDNRLENLAVMSPSDHQSHHFPSGTLVRNQYGVFALRRDRVA